MSHTPDQNEQSYLEEHCKALRESIDFWSPDRKLEREAWVVKTFLRHLVIPYRETELRPEPSEPPDINFRDARFEIKEILDDDRRRHQEYRQKLEKAMSATSPRELGEQYIPRDLTYPEIGDRLVRLLDESSRHYAANAIEGLDLLVYVNLLKRIVDAESPIPHYSTFARYGWRSVSVVRSAFACVLYARSDAPDFIRAHLGEHRARPGVE